jgi:hypothetical protein
MGVIAKNGKLFGWLPVELTFVAKEFRVLNRISVAFAEIKRRSVRHFIVLGVNVVGGYSSVKGFAEFMINARVIAYTCLGA